MKENRAVAIISIFIGLIGIAAAGVFLYFYYVVPKYIEKEPNNINETPQVGDIQMSAEEFEKQYKELYVELTTNAKFKYNSTKVTGEVDYAINNYYELDNETKEEKYRVGGVNYSKAAGSKTFTYIQYTNDGANYIENLQSNVYGIFSIGPNGEDRMFQHKVTGFEDGSKEYLAAFPQGYTEGPTYTFNDKQVKLSSVKISVNPLNKISRIEVTFDDGSVQSVDISDYDFPEPVRTLDITQLPIVSGLDMDTFKIIVNSNADLNKLSTINFKQELYDHNNKLYETITWESDLKNKTGKAVSENSNNTKKNLTKYYQPTAKYIIYDNNKVNGIERWPEDLVEFFLIKDEIENLLSFVQYQSSIDHMQATVKKNGNKIQIDFVIKPNTSADTVQIENLSARTTSFEIDETNLISRIGDDSGRMFFEIISKDQEVDTKCPDRLCTLEKSQVNPGISPYIRKIYKISDTVTNEFIFSPSSYNKDNYAVKDNILYFTKQTDVQGVIDKLVAYDMTNHTFYERKLDFTPGSEVDLEIINNELYFASSAYMEQNSLYKFSLPLNEDPYQIIDEDADHIFNEEGKYWVSEGFGDECYGYNNYRPFFPETDSFGKLIKTEFNCGEGIELLDMEGHKVLLADHDKNPFSLYDNYMGQKGEFNRIYTITGGINNLINELVPTTQMPAAIANIIVDEEKNRLVLVGPEIYVYDLNTFKLNKIADATFGDSVEFATNTSELITKEGRLCITLHSKAFELDLEKGNWRDVKECVDSQTYEYDVEQHIKTLNLPANMKLTIEEKKEE